MEKQDIFIITIVLILIILLIIASVKHKCNEDFNFLVYQPEPPGNPNWIYTSHEDVIKNKLPEIQKTENMPCNKDSDCGPFQQCIYITGNDQPRCHFSIVNNCIADGVC